MAWNRSPFATSGTTTSAFPKGAAACNPCSKRFRPTAVAERPRPRNIRAAAKLVAWAIERPDGGRGFGFTGGHIHKNWGNDNFRKFVLNSLLWTAKADVPAERSRFEVDAEELGENLDPKK